MLRMVSALALGLAVFQANATQKDFFTIESVEIREIGSGIATAEDLCQSLSQSEAIEIARWHASGWDAHICGLPFNNFTLVLGDGYFVRMQQSAALSMTGLPPLAGLEIQLSSGWNLVGLPPGVNLTAASAGESIHLQGGQCSEIARWYAGGWDSHLLGLPFNNYALEPGQGYFIRCQQASVWNVQP